MAYQRARNQENKAERRAAIIDAALVVCASKRYETLTLADVAAGTGLAKATLFLYFPSKEALYLAALERELERYFAALDARLDQGGRWSTARVVGAMVGSLREQPALPRLLALQESTLEHNIDFETALAFKRLLLERTRGVASRLAKRLPGIDVDAGMRLFILARALVIGLWQTSDASAVMRRVLAQPEMASFDIDFYEWLSPALEALVSGLRAANGEPSPR